MPEPRSYFSVKENNLNAPNIDTWLPSSNFLQVGFRPGYSLQARELIEIQSILQNQITLFAEDLGYANGSVVNLNSMYMHRSEITSNTEGTGTRYSVTLTLSPGYVFVSPTNRIGYFANYIYPTHLEFLTWVVDIDDIEGESPVVFFGVTYVEETILPEQEMDLYDNASGFPNFNAPGAVRYKINVGRNIDYRIEQVVSSPEKLHIKVNENIRNDHYDFDSEKFLPLFYWTNATTDDIANEEEFRFLHSEYNNSHYVEIFDGDYGCEMVPPTRLFEYISKPTLNVRMFNDDEAENGKVYGG